MPRIRIEVPDEAPLFETVPCLRERLIRPTKYGPMEFERDGELDGVSRYTPSKPRPPLEYVCTDYPGVAYEIPRPTGPSDEKRFASVGYGMGSSAAKCANGWSPEDEEREERREHGRRARSFVKDPFGKRRKAKERGNTHS